MSFGRAYVPSPASSQASRLSARYGFSPSAITRAFELRIEHRERDLDPAEEVASHPVGAREPDLVAAVVREIPDPAVLEEAADDRAHADVLGEALDARAAARRRRAR